MLIQYPAPKQKKYVLGEYCVMRWVVLNIIFFGLEFDGAIRIFGSENSFSDHMGVRRGLVILN